MRRLALTLGLLGALLALTTFGPVDDALTVAASGLDPVTVVDGLPFDNRLFTEELFLPFLVVGGIDTLDEGLEIANSVDYGLTSGIFSSDQKELEEFFSSIQAGVCYSNKQGGATTGAMVGAQPFVGWKMSGSTGKGAGGLYYLAQFMREQTQSMFS